MKTALFTRGRERLQVRADETGSATRTISGYGAVFYQEGDAGTQYQLWDDMVERIMPGAFDRALREDDVRSLFNHDPNFVLGRRRPSADGAQTLRLSIDAVGLRYEVDPPAARADVVDSVERGDVDGSSFMFEPLEVVWRETDQLFIREIVAVKLWEVGPVVFPAYESTTTGLRERYRQRLLEERTAWKRDGSAPRRGPNASLPAPSIPRRQAIAARARAIGLREKRRIAGQWPEK